MLTFFFRSSIPLSDDPAIADRVGPPASFSPVDLPMTPSIIQFEQVGKAYPEAGRSHTVLRDVSFAIGAGEVVAILGRSGSGKTTVLNLMAGIDQPTQGRVRVAGEDLGAMSDRERTRFRLQRIGFVYQFFNLIPTLSALENVRLPLELGGASVADADRRAMAELAAVGLADRAASFPDRLSGGEQQRVAIARALVTDPPLILADEPTGNLDPEIGDQVLALLLERSRASGRSLIMVTHSRRIAAAADRVLRVEGHGVIEAQPEPA